MAKYGSARLWASTSRLLHTLSRDPVLIRVTDLFGLDTEKVPLPPPEHLHRGKDEALERDVNRRLGDVKHPDEANDDVGGHGDVVVLLRKGPSAIVAARLVCFSLLQVEAMDSPSSRAGNRRVDGVDPNRRASPTKTYRTKPRPPT
jgi:hypothetical protein